jgi:hypothetical protein
VEAEVEIEVPLNSHDNSPPPNKIGDLPSTGVTMALTTSPMLRLNYSLALGCDTEEPRRVNALPGDES